MYIILAGVREAQFLILDFLFERNEQYTISNIYNLQGITIHTNNYNETTYCNLLLYFYLKFNNFIDF